MGHQRLRSFQKVTSFLNKLPVSADRIIEYLTFRSHCIITSQVMGSPCMIVQLENRSA